MSRRELRCCLWDLPLRGIRYRLGWKEVGATCVAMTEVEVAQSRCSGRPCTPKYILLGCKSKVPRISLGELEIDRPEGGA